MSDGKVQLEAELDASRVKQGAAEVTGAVRQMGREVERESSRVSAATAKMGSGGEQAAQNTEKASRSIIASIQRQTAAYEAGGRSTREYYEAIARQRGVGADVLKPYLDQLDAAKDKQEQAAGGADKLGNSLISLKGAFAAAAAAAISYVTIDAAKAILDQADAVSLLNSRLRLAVGGADEFAAAQQGLFQLAQSNSVGLSETITLYTRLSDPIKRLGGGMNEVIGVTNAFQKALQLGGVSAQEAASATLQFGQALGAGVLAGDEFRSLAEASPRLLKAIADGANLPIESLKKLGSEGKLTAEVVSNALLSMGGQLEAEFSQMPDTVGKAMTRLKNVVITSIGDMNENTNLTLGVAAMVDEASKLVPLFYSELGGAIQSVGVWLQENKDWIVATIESTKGLIADVWNVGKAAMSVAGAFGGWIGQINIVATAITGIRILLAGVQDGVRILAGTFSWLGGVILSAVLAPVQAVIRGLSAAASLLGKAEWSASLNSASAAMLNFSTAGIKAGEGIYREFSNGQSALGKLSSSLSDTSKAMAGTGTAARLAGTGFKALKGSAGEAEDATRKAGKAAKEAKDEFAELFSKLTAKDVGLDPKFYQQLNTLHEGYKQGRINIDQYRTAVESLISSQQFAKDVAKELADAEKKLQDARKKERDEYARYTESLSDGNAKLREEIDTLGMSRAEKAAYTQALNDATIAKLEEKAATMELYGADEELLAQIRAQITALQDRNALLGRKEVVEAQIDANKKMVDEAQKTADSINQSLTDALLRGFESGKDFGKNFRDTLVNMFKTLVLRPVISFIVQPIGNAISGGVTNLLGGQGGAGNPLGMASNLNTAWGMLNGTGTGLSGIGYNMLAGLPGSVGYGMLPGMTVGSQQAAMLAAQTQAFGGAGLQATAGAAQTAQGASWMTSSAAGLAAVAAPLIIGSIIEGNSRDRYGGAAYATSNWQSDAFVNAVGADFNALTGDIPNREALIERAIAAGIERSTVDLFQGNDRALLHYIRMAEDPNRNEFGGLPDPRKLIAEGNLYNADFYRGQGFASPQEMGWWNNKGYDLTAVDPRVVEASRALSLSIVAPLSDMARMLGDAEADFRVTTGFANRGKGAMWGALDIQRGGESIGGFDQSDFKNVQEYMRAVYSEAMDAFGALELPEWARGQVEGAQTAMDALKGDKLGEEAAALYQQTTAGIEQMYRSIQMLIDVFPDFADATQDSLFALQELMGGMENLQSAYSSYMQNFWSEEERAALTRRQIEAELGNVGLALPETREQFRALVEAQDLSTEAGRAAFAALMGVADAFAAVTPAAESAADAAGRLADEARRLAEEAYSSARSRTDDVWARLQQLFNDQIDNWQKLADEARAIFDIATDAARQLRGEVADTRAWDAAQGREFIAQALAGLRSTGALPDSDALSRAIESALGGLSMDGYATAAEYEFDQLVLAGQLKEIGEISGTQASFAKQQVNLLKEQMDQWRKQLDLLRGMDLNITTIAEGVTVLADAMLAEQAAAQAAAEAAAQAAPTTGGGGGRGSFGGGGPDMAPIDYAAEAEMLKAQDWWGKGDWSKVLGWSLGGVSAATGISPEDLEKFLATKVMQVANDGRIIPKFDVGTNYVPRDMIAQIHEGERIIPAADNARLMALLANASQGGQNDALVAEVKALRAEVTALRAERTAADVPMHRMAWQFANVTAGGNAMMTETA